VSKLCSKPVLKGWFFIVISAELAPKGAIFGPKMTKTGIPERDEHQFCAATPYQPVL